MSAKSPNYQPASLIQTRRNSTPTLTEESLNETTKKLTTQAEAVIGDLLKPRADSAAVVLHIDQVVPQPQPRTTFDEESIRELAADIAEHGQHDPILVEALGGNRYGIVAGERRYRAIRLNNGDTIRATIRAYSEDAIKRDLVQLSSNEQRSNFTKLELARAYRRLQEKYGWTDAELGDRLHQSRVYVARVKSLLNAPTEVQEAIENGRESFSNWINHRDEVMRNVSAGEYRAPVKSDSDNGALSTKEKGGAAKTELSFALPMSTGRALLKILQKHPAAKKLKIDVPKDATRRQMVEIITAYVDQLRGAK